MQTVSPQTWDCVCVHLFSWVHISTQTEEWVIQWDSESQEHRVCPHDEHIMQFSQLTSNEWTCQTHEPHGYCMMLPWQHSSVLCGLNGHSCLSWLPKQWGLTTMWPPDSTSTREEQRLCISVISIWLNLCFLSAFIKWQQQPYEKRCQC